MFEVVVVSKLAVVVDVVLVVVVVEVEAVVVVVVVADELGLAQEGKKSAVFVFGVKNFNVIQSDVFSAAQLLAHKQELNVGRDLMVGQICFSPRAVISCVQLPLNSRVVNGFDVDLKERASCADRRRKPVPKVYANCFIFVVFYCLTS